MPRLLVVDDSRSVQVMLKSILSRVGSVDQASDGREALEMVESSLLAGQGYHAVLMDIMMPEMDGLTASRLIIELMDDHNIPLDERPKIIMVSCLSDPEHMSKAHFEIGADAYLTKPFDERNLLEVLENLGVVSGGRHGSPDMLPEFDIG